MHIYYNFILKIQRLIMVICGMLPLFNKPLEKKLK